MDPLNYVDEATALFRTAALLNLGRESIASGTPTDSHLVPQALSAAADAQHLIEKRLIAVLNMLDYRQREYVLTQAVNLYPPHMLQRINASLEPVA